jgi:hypothetical protein
MGNLPDSKIEQKLLGKRPSIQPPSDPKLDIGDLSSLNFQKMTTAQKLHIL